METGFILGFSLWVSTSSSSSCILSCRRVHDGWSARRNIWRQLNSSITSGINNAVLWVKQILFPEINDHPISFNNLHLFRKYNNLPVIENLAEKIGKNFQIILQKHHFIHVQRNMKCRKNQQACYQFTGTLHYWGKLEKETKEFSHCYFLLIGNSRTILLEKWKWVISYYKIFSAGIFPF